MSKNPLHSRGWLMVIVGVLYILFGIFFFMKPGVTYMGLVIYFMVSFLASGIIYLVDAFTQSKNDFGILLAVGILNIVVAFLLIAHPAITALTLPFVVGFMLLINAFELFQFSNTIKSFGPGIGKYTFWLGVLVALLSCILMFFPTVGALTIVYWTAIAFIVAGAGNTYLGWKLKNL